MTPRRALARLAALGLTAAALAIAPLAGAQSTEPAIPEFHGYVNDSANVLREETRAKLESFLDQVEKKTGAEFAVLTVPSCAPMDPSEYKVKVFEAWKIGKKGKDNGLLMLLSMQERAVRFETGYGLEGVLTDMTESRIVREQMVPLLRAGDVDGAVTQGVLAASARIARDANVTLEWNGEELRYTGGSPRERSFPVGWIAFIIFIILANILRGVSGIGRRRGGWYIGRGGWGGGFGGFGGFGGGGFGGGGGGGGSSFGGFGGGSSGGGGGGGSW